VDPLSKANIERVDDALVRVRDVVEELAMHEPEEIEPIVAMLSIILEATDPGERIFRSYRAHPPLGAEATPGAEIARDAFDALRDVATRALDCFAVTRYVVQKHTGAGHEAAGTTWRKVQPGGIVFDDVFFLNAPVHEHLETRGSFVVFGVKLTGGPPLPIVVDLAARKHSLADERLWFAAYESMLGEPPTGVQLRMTQKEQVSLDLAELDWTTLDRLWRPPSLPEGARSGPASIQPISRRSGLPG
jgi:hypothetical protein